MKLFLIFLVVAGLAAGAYYAYDSGMLDSVLGSKEEGTTPSTDGSSSTTGSTASTPLKAVDPPKEETSKVPEEPKLDPALQAKLEKQYPMPDFKPLLEIVSNWSNVPKRAFPSAVTVKVPVEYKLMRDGQQIGSTTTPAGGEAVPLDFAPGKLKISNHPTSTMSAVVNVDDTDFKERIQQRYDELVAQAEGQVLASRRVAAEVMSQPAGADDPAVMASGWHDPNDPRFASAREYLQAGKFKTAGLDEAKRWRWLGTQNVGGRSYEVVLVDFEMQTIFGTFPNTLKCLLSNGQVVKWVDADTGEERG